MLLLGWVVRIFLFLVFALGSLPAGATTIDMTKIGGVFVKTSAATTVLSALGAFRGAFGPIGTAIAVGSTLQQLGLFDGLTNLFIKAGLQASDPTPSGWSGPNSPPAAVSADQSMTWNATVYHSANDLAAGFCSYYNMTNPHMSGDHVACTIPASGNEYISGLSWSPGVASCPPGYTVSGQNCNLTNPNVVSWPSDGNATIQPQSNGPGFTSTPRDPDSPSNYNPMDISRAGVDPFGNPVKETVSTNADGGLDYTRDTEGVNPQTGEPMVQRDKISTDHNGTVTSGTTTTYNNSTINNVVTNNSSTQSAIDISSLAKEATLQKAEDDLKKIDKDLTTKDPTDMPTIPGARTFQASTELVINKFKTWFPLPTVQDAAGQCPIFSKFIPFLNIQMVIDQQCTLEPVVRPPIELAMMAAWPILAIGLFLKA